MGTCRPEHFTDEKVDEFIRMLPRKLLDALLPFQLDGLRFGLRRGGRCLIADEMGLGKTLQIKAVLDVGRKGQAHSSSVWDTFFVQV
ncbi:DNA annealing helicase and endonuclease ZRANB [Salix suchowensis]|nr:DNA annealing helicase and endonuclease ZRANB [Salix suchowensis]